jgi:hypothetical protein
MTQALLRSGKAFIRWYWNQLKRAPRDFALFTAGGVYVAFLLLPYLVH